MSTLTPGQLGVKEALRLPQCPVLIPKRKKPGGFGFLPNTPDDRFYIVQPNQDAAGIRQEHPSYKRFNDCTAAAIVSRIPCVLGGHERDDIVELSRTFHRWDNKNMGKPPGEYSPPRHQGPWCSTQRATQGGDHPLAQRWNGEEYKEIECGGDKCPYTASPMKGSRPPCLKRARIWFFPKWDVLASMIREDKGEKAQDIAESIRRLPNSPLKLVTGGQYAPSVVAWEQFLGSVEKQLSALGLWPTSLMGLPFWLSVGKRKGDGTRYTVYGFEMSGSVETWLMGQQAWRKQLEDGKRYLLLGPGAVAEQDPETIAADALVITDMVIPSRPAVVADVPVAEVTAPRDDPPDADDVAADPPARDVVKLTVGKISTLRKAWVDMTGRDVEALDAWSQMKLGARLEGLPATDETAVLTEITRIARISKP